MNSLDSALNTAGDRMKAATDRFNSIMQNAQSRVDAVAETRMQRRLDIMTRYIEMIKKTQELAALSGIPITNTPKP